MKKGKRIPGHRHCPNLVRDAGKKPPPARGTTHYSRRALSSTALLSLLNCARACPSIVGISQFLLLVRVVCSVVGWRPGL